MESAAVINTIYSNVMRITLNNPEKGNVVNSDNLTLLHSYIKDAENNPEVRAIILEGSKGIFSRGMDFKFMLESRGASGSSEGMQIDRSFHEPYLNAVTSIRDCPKPVVAAVDGEVLAGGMGLAMACDIVIATKRSIFGLSEVLFGLIPAYVFPFLLERTTFKRARYMILSSEKFSAENCYQFGLVDHLCENDALEKTITRYMKRILASSPRALAVTKEYSCRIKDQPVNEAVWTAADQLTDLLNVADNVKAIQSFVDGEMMPWMARYKRPKKES